MTYIDSGNMILNMDRKAQHLENVEEKETFTERELTRALRDAIIAENGAINQYETVVDSTSNEKVKEVLQSIADEEKVHVGELQALLKSLLPDEEGFLEDGADEVGDVEKTAGRAQDKGITEEDVDSEELKMGIEVELEHTEDRAKAKKIALDHLAEIKDYYTRLKKMEAAGGVKD